MAESKAKELSQDASLGFLMLQLIHLKSQLEIAIFMCRSLSMFVTVKFFFFSLSYINASYKYIDLVFSKPNP